MFLIDPITLEVKTREEWNLDLCEGLINIYTFEELKECNQFGEIL